MSSLILLSHNIPEQDARGGANDAKETKTSYLHILFYYFRIIYCQLRTSNGTRDDINWRGSRGSTSKSIGGI